MWFLTFLSKIDTPSCHKMTLFVPKSTSPKRRLIKLADFQNRQFCVSIFDKIVKKPRPLSPVSLGLARRRELSDFYHFYKLPALLPQFETLLIKFDHYCRDVTALKFLSQKLHSISGVMRKCPTSLRTLGPLFHYTWGASIEKDWARLRPGDELRSLFTFTYPLFMKIRAQNIF